jgi:DNA-binding response OmpR family regulator
MTKILLVDDSAFFRRTVRGYLEEAGYLVDDFMPLSELEVMERAKVWMPDLVITDYTMPHVDGFMVARMIRRHAKEVPILVLTAVRDREREDRLRTLGLLTIVYKPVAGPDLVNVVKALKAP